jgi:hypothetical protein
MLCRQADGEGGVVELGIMARTRNRADIHEAFDAVSMQHGHKALDRLCRMPDCEDRALRPILKRAPQAAERRHVEYSNTGWRNESFRGYANYMQTEGFQEALAALIRMSRQKRGAIMCAEAVPWHCHRSLVANALSVHGIPVVEILSESAYRIHKLTPFARVDGSRITYPPEQPMLI